MRVRAALLVLMAGITVRVAAQWDIGVEINTTHYRGSSRVVNDSSGPTTIRPANATAFGVRMDRAIGRTRLGVQVSYATVGLTAGSPGLTLTDNSSGEVLEGQVLLNFQVVGIGSSGAIRAEVGPSLHLWKGVDATRSRIGAIVASAYEWPVTRRLAGAIRLEGMLSQSWFEPGDLPPELERQVTWRYGVGLGLRYRL
jgi:hypothetical protein